MTDLLFESLELPISRVAESFGGSYKVVGSDGKVAEVEAATASEAAAKSGIGKPVKIVNMAYERQRLLEKYVLLPDEGKALTSIDMENPAFDLRFLVIEDLEDAALEPFVEMSALEMFSPQEMAGMVGPEREIAPADEVLLPEAEGAGAFDVQEASLAVEVQAMEPPAGAASPMPAEEMPPVVDEGRELTPSDVRKLLSPGEPGDGAS